MNPTIAAVTERIVERSGPTRAAYLERCRRAAEAGTARAHLSCGNIAHVAPAAGRDKAAIARGRGGNIGIVTAYNDMLSAHQPFERFPDIIKAAARDAGGTAQVAGGVAGDVRRRHARAAGHGALALLAGRDRARGRRRAQPQLF